jgi:hypothetical protein
MFLSAFRLVARSQSLAKLLPLAIAFVADSAKAFNFSVGPVFGYEVLSYRDSPTNLTGGAVSAGDAFEQASFKGPQFGVSSSIGIVRIDALEPVAGVDLVFSKLEKSASAEGITTSGGFNFLQSGVNLGARWWLFPELVSSVQVQFSTALQNKMYTRKTVESSSAQLGEVAFDLSSHKKTSLLAAIQWLGLSESIALGLDLRLGSGCFDCKSTTTALQHRTYLTRSGAVSMSLMLGNQSRAAAPVSNIKKAPKFDNQPRRQPAPQYKKKDVTIESEESAGE